MDDRESISARVNDLPRRAPFDIKLPHLCTPPGYRPDGNRLHGGVEGERVLAASCLRTPPGMKVKTQTDRAKTRAAWWRIAADRSAGQAHAHDPDSELWKIVKRQKIEAGRFPTRPIEVPAPTAATLPWRSISMRAFNAICASALAAKCRSMM